jgi:hypothetical protein
MVDKNGKMMKQDASFARVASLGPDAIDVGCNIYWDIAGGKEEREEREAFLLSVMQLGKSLELSFYDNRRMHQA